jgi:hypothetical protein
VKFNSAQSVEQVVWQMRLADYPRAVNRARINNLFNGAPPYTAQEQDENNIATNVNDLSSTNLDLTARRQFQNAFCAPDPLFKISLDYGPAYKRLEWGDIITKAINKQLINSPKFLDLRDGCFASVVLHGVGPTGWSNKQSWLPTEYGIEDILIPSNTNRSLDNLPFFAIYRSYTVNQLWKMARGPVVDRGWQQDVVSGVLKWADEQAQKLLGQTWPEVWSPDKMEERFKQDGGLYASDAVPTVDCYDFYFWNDDGKQSGWNRRIILDAWGQPGVGRLSETTYKSNPKDSRRKEYEFGKGKFLYTSGKRIFADKLEKIIHMQFGDASAVAPFKYHSIRALGFLLYAVCHLQNRLKCRFNDAVFESLMQYFRVNNPTDMDRLMKVDLVDKGFLPEGLEFVKPEDRWKYDEGLATAAIAMNEKAMQNQAGPFVQDYEPEKADETATLTMAKVNSSASIVGAAMAMGYMREKFRYIEICRRYCIRDSRDRDVRECRRDILSQGVPAEAMNADRWDIQVTRAIGSGNKMMEVAIADKLMAVREKHSPQAQSQILTIYDAAITGDYALAKDLNPILPLVSDSVHDSEIAFGSIMAGSAVTPRPGLNPIEVSETILKLMQARVQEIMQSGGVGTPADIIGLNKAAQYVSGFIQQLAQDRQQKARVKQYGDALGKIMNEVKAFEQRQQEQAQQQNANGHIDPKDAAKIQAILITAQTKAKMASESHAQRTAQRQLQFEQKQKQEEAKHFADLVQTENEHQQKKRISLFDEGE